MACTFPSCGRAWRNTFVLSLASPQQPSESIRVSSVVAFRGHAGRVPRLREDEAQLCIWWCSRRRNREWKGELRCKWGSLGAGIGGWPWKKRGKGKAGGRSVTRVHCTSSLQNSFGERQDIFSLQEVEGFLDLRQDLAVAGLVLAGAVALVKVFGYAAQRNLFERKLSRKLVHISSGLLYLTCWPLFSGSPWARFIAALVPLVNLIRFLITGFGLQQNEALVKSMSREGDPRELLEGPFYYVMVLMLSTIFFWRESPVGMISLAMMCGGDGIADIVGRRYGSLKLPYNAEKSWAGSIAMCSFGFLVSVGFLWYFSAWGFFQRDMADAVPRVALIALAATVVESLPLKTGYDDNLTVPLTTVLLGLVLFPAGFEATT